MKEVFDIFPPNQNNKLISDYIYFKDKVISEALKPRVFQWDYSKNPGERRFSTIALPDIAMTKKSRRQNYNSLSLKKKIRLKRMTNPSYATRESL